jgi:hypothetical protein
LAVAAVMAAFGMGSAAQAQASSLTTTFEGGDGWSGFAFSLDVFPVSGVQVEGFDTNLLPGVTSLSVYTRPWEMGVSLLDSTDGWTPRGTVPISGAVANTPTPVPISFFLPNGRSSVVFLASGAPLLYTRQEACVDDMCVPPDSTTEDSALRINSGVGFSGFGGTVGGGELGARIWNGTIYYSVGAPAGAAPPSAGTGQRAAALKKCKKKKKGKKRKKCKKRAKKLPV